MNTQKWLDAAKIFDHWRVVPRLILGVYFGWVVYLTQYLVIWYTHIPMAERDAYTTSLVTLITGFLTGLFPWIYRIYSDASTDWSSQPQSQTTSTLVSQTETVSPK